MNLVPLSVLPPQETGAAPIALLLPDGRKRRTAPDVQSREGRALPSQDEEAGPEILLPNSRFS